MNHHRRISDKRHLDAAPERVAKEKVTAILSLVIQLSRRMSKMRFSSLIFYIIFIYEDEITDTLKFFLLPTHFQDLLPITLLLI